MVTGFFFGKKLNFNIPESVGEKYVGQAGGRRLHEGLEANLRDSK
jgi:hypothetical protein